MKRTATIVAIDPGQTGGIAVLYLGELAETYPMPTTSRTLGNGKKRRRVDGGGLADIFDEIEPDMIVVEDVGHAGAGGAFAFGHACGVVWGASHAWPVALVRPKVWQAAAGVAAVDGDRKKAHRARAAALFPDFADRFALAKHDGQADAALIAYSAWTTAPSADGAA